MDKDSWTRLLRWSKELRTLEPNTQVFIVATKTDMLKE